MKQMTEYNRVSGYLNKIFALLNETYFENALSKHEKEKSKCRILKTGALTTKMKP